MLSADDGVLVDAGISNPILSNIITASGNLNIELVNQGNQEQPAPILISATGTARASPCPARSVSAITA